MDAGREVCRRPVEDDAEPGLMGAVDKADEAGGIAESPGRRQEPDRLIAPGGIQQMLDDGEQLEMDDAEPGSIRNQRLGELVTGEEAANLTPRADARLVGANWPAARVADAAAREEDGVVDDETVGARDHRGGEGPELGAEAEWIGLQRQMPVVTYPLREGHSLWRDRCRYSWTRWGIQNSRIAGTTIGMAW